MSQDAQYTCLTCQTLAGLPEEAPLVVQPPLPEGFPALQATLIPQIQQLINQQGEI